MTAVAVLAVYAILGGLLYGAYQTGRAVERRRIARRFADHVEHDLARDA